MAKKVKKCLRKIFDKTFFHFFGQNFFPSARIALKPSEMIIFGLFYPWMRSKLKKIEKKNFENFEIFSKTFFLIEFFFPKFFSIFFTFYLIQG